MNWEEMLGEFNSRSVSNKKRNNMSWLSSLFSGGLGIVGSIIQNAFNVRQQKEVNKNNRELVQMQNDAAAAESEKAYERSLPVNQVGNMRAAGMSHAAAINALNDGGSYQPAPVNTAQDQAPQIDVSQAINALQASAQLAEQKRQFNLQHAEQKRQFDAEHKLKEDESRLRNKLVNEQITDVIASYTGKGLDNALKDLEYRVQKANEGRRISAEESEYLARDAAAALDTLKSLKQSDAWTKLTAEQIAAYYELQAKLEILSNLGNTKATDLLAKIISVF